MIATLLLLASPSQEAPQALPLRPAIGRFVVDAARSQVGFDGTSTLHDFSGKTSKIHGEIRVDPTRPGATLGGSCWVPAASLDTDNRLRDREMRKRLDVDEHPRIRFEALSASGTEEGQLGDVALVGVFDIHGVRRERRIAARLEGLDGGAYKATGELRFDVSDHGIDPPSMLFVSMGDEIRLWFDVTFVPVEAEILPAFHRELEVDEEIVPVRGEPLRQTTSSGLWTSGDDVLWERPSEARWVLVARSRTRSLDMRRATEHPLPGASERAFEETRGRIDKLSSRLAEIPEGQRESVGLRIESTIARLEESLANAPPAGVCTVVAEEGSISLRLGGEEWAVFEGLEGAEPFARLLLCEEGIPAEIRRHLAELEGVPRRFEIRCATPAGTRRIRGRLGPVGAGAVPAWAWSPSDWVRSPGTGVSR